MNLLSNSLYIPKSSFFSNYLNETKITTPNDDKIEKHLLDEFKLWELENAYNAWDQSMSETEKILAEIDKGSIELSDENIKLLKEYLAKLE